MTKPPLHNIDSLFQQKLEDLPVDVSHQQEQWQLLRKTLHQPPAGWVSSLQKSWVKWIYLTAVALVPFGVFYVATQKTVAEKAALIPAGGCVTRSLLLLNKPVQALQPSVAEKKMPAATVIARRQANTSTPALSQAVEERVNMSMPPVTTGKDSVLAPPVKQDKPVTKKADSSYLYWQ